MKRLTGVIGKSGKFALGYVPQKMTRKGASDESAAQQRVMHSAELQQAFLPDGTVNDAYTTLYHEAAINQGIIEEDAEPDFSAF